MANKIAIEHDFAREDDYQGEFSSSDEARQELGWEPKVDFEEGIRIYIEWYRDSLKRD
ncbi:hypothetical protein ACFLUD_03015 [Chloroflexota bacterium]